MLLLLDADAPLSALSGGDDELRYMFHNPPKFLVEDKLASLSWAYNDLCAMARISGLLDNKFTFTRVLNAYEKAMDQPNGNGTNVQKLKKTQSHSSLTVWAGRLKTTVSFVVFKKFWKIIAVDWAEAGTVPGALSLDNENKCLHFLLQNRLLPVIAGDNLICQHIQLHKNVSYDLMSMGMIRQNESALEAIYKRYSTVNLGAVEVEVNSNARRPHSSNINEFQSSNKQNGERGCWGSKISPQLGMSEANFLEFANDFNIVPSLIALDDVRSIFASSGKLLNFARLNSDVVDPFVVFGGGSGEVSFVGFLECLLRSGLAMQLADIMDNDDNDNDNDNEKNYEKEAHLDVLFRSIDPHNKVFFRSFKHHNPKANEDEELDVFLKAVVNNDDDRFTFSNALQICVRLNMGEIGVVPIFYIWEEMSFGRDALGADEMKIILKHVYHESCQANLLAIKDYTKFLRRVLPTATKTILEESENVCARPPKCKLFELSEEIIGDLLIDALGAIWSIVVCDGFAPVAEVAQIFHNRMVSANLLTEDAIYEAAALAVSTLGGGSTGGNKMQMTRVQVDWTVIQLIADCGGGGGDNNEGNGNDDEDKFLLFQILFDMLLIN